MQHLLPMPLLWLLTSAVMIQVSQPAFAEDLKLSPQDTVAAFRAAGFKKQGKHWIGCDKEGSIRLEARDINGDGLPEALITEGSARCYGNAGGGYTLVSKQSSGQWKRISEGTGEVHILRVTSVGGWPDLLLAGPGFCFPVLRWNGKAYVLHHHEYDGKRCKP